MPHRTVLYYSRVTRLFGALVYLTVVGVGVRTFLWTPAHIYSPVQINLMSTAGVITIIGSGVSLIAYLLFKWRWESIAVWITALGLSGYALISALTLPPQNITQLVSLTTTALCLCLMTRGVTLFSFAQRTKGIN